MDSVVYQWLFGVFGLIFGSFFNVLIYRVPRELPIAWPPSHCPECDHPIRPKHNIPVLGWLMLGGRCADCRSLISIQYPLVEALCGFLGWWGVQLALAQSGVFQWGPTIAMFWLMITLVPIAAVDFKYQLIPDTVSLGGIVVGFAVSFLPGGIPWTQSLLGIAVAGGGLFAFGWIMGKVLKRDAMGFGDVKLLAAFGAFLGWTHALAAVIAASFLALIIMIPWRFIKKTESMEPLPFGPFIAIMGPVFYLYGDAIIGWYWGLLR